VTIAYDLRFADDHFTGIGTHAYCLLESLLARPDPERYAVLWSPGLSSSRFDLAAIRRHPRVEWIERPLPPLGVSSLWRIGQLLREIRPAVYYSPFYFMPLHPGCPCVLTLHDVWPLRLPGGLGFWRRALYQLALARATGARFVLTSSEFSRREIAELSGLEAEQIRVVPLGIPPARGTLEPRRPARVPDREFALTVGVNKPHKNLAVLVHAWKRFGASPPLQLVTAGPDDPRHPTVQRLAERAGAKAITTLGRVDEPELEWLYRHATMVLFPTLYEGFGLPVVEAYAHGLPVVASNIPALREVGSGVARFVAPLDAAAWGAAVRELAGDPATRRAMADAGRARAAELTYERTARATLEVLREAARPPAAAFAGAGA
jgi:glycosyltransferase involved in cell wall biosynthesis